MSAYETFKKQLEETQKRIEGYGMLGGPGALPPNPPKPTPTYKPSSKSKTRSRSRYSKGGKRHHSKKTHKRKHRKSRYTKRR